VRLDVSGRRPWPGPDWDSFEVVLHGMQRRSFLALNEGEAVSYRRSEPDGELLYLFGLPPRVVTPPGRQPRHEPSLLLIDRLEVGVAGSPARLVADFEADRLYLDIGEERRKGQLDRVLDGLPLVQLPPRTGRPVGSRQVEDVGALRGAIEVAVHKLRRDHRRVTVRAVANEIGYHETTLSRKLRRLKIPLPR